LTEKIPDKPFLLYVGLRGGYKNFNRFLQAVASSTTLKSSFTVTAFGGGAFNAAEQSLIQTLGFQLNQIRQVSGDDALLAQHYSQASALVYPSTYEGFGLPPLEAMSLGCPVISSHASVMPEICGNAAEYFEPLDIESIRQAIEAVLSSIKRRDELIAKGLAQAAHYSWPICAERHLSVYQRLFNTSVFTQ
jgi:glycosyltransferase involved in cell wall biosynthesis